MKRRNITALLGTILLLVGIIGCGRKEKELMILSQEEFFSYGIETELTTKNWENFFELQPGTVMEAYNSAGTYTYQYLHLVPKEFCVISGEQADLTMYGTRVGIEELYLEGCTEPDSEYELQTEVLVKVSIGDDKTAGALALIYEKDNRVRHQTFPDSENVRKVIGLFRDGEVKELVCWEAAGTISSFAIPEEEWNVDEDGVRFLCIGEEGTYFRIFEPTFYDDVRRYWKKTDRLGGGV